MTDIERKVGDYRDLNFNINLEGYYNKNVNDIEDIVFVIKGDIGNQDNILFQKKLSSNGIEIVSGTTNIEVNVKWLYNEYDQFNYKKKYICGLYCKFVNEPIVDENTDDFFVISFIDDVINQS